MTLYKWSQTAADNDDADSTVNLREGQAPSTLNNASRAIMAAGAKFRDDLSGALTTGGSSTAYTVTTNQAFAALQDGLIVCFTPHTTSGAAPTFAPDGLTAKPLRGYTGQDLPAGVLSQGTPYMARYDSSDEEWLLHGFYEAPGGVPIGASVEYGGSTAPNTSWLLEYGQAVSRTTYATLFARIGTTYGAGDESTTFNLPDCRGRVTAGKDDMGGTSANRLTNQTGGLNGDTLGATGGSETVTLTASHLPDHNVAVAVTDPGHVHGGVKYKLSTGGTNGPSAFWFEDQTVSTSSATTGITAAGSFGNTQRGGAQAAHNLVQPTIIKLKMIRAL
jgi:microcystin-dependent protein